MKSLRLGTRKSALAQAQANWVTRHLHTAFPDVHIEILLIQTSGDLKSEGKPASGEGGLKALFTKEIEEALLDRRIDLAVHSLKDMAAELPQGLRIGAVPEREDPRDVWISKSNIPFRSIPKNAKIGTGAVRRQAQLKHYLPSAEIVAIRGNVDTRLTKLSEGDLDGIVLALAGLRRLGRERSITDILPTDILMPAVGQGCLGIEVRDNDEALEPYLKALDHPNSRMAALAERAFLKTLSGSCQTPIAGHARVSGDWLSMMGLVISPDGTTEVRSELAGSTKDPESLGNTLARKLLASGADKILLL